MTIYETKHSDIFYIFRPEAEETVEGKKPPGVMSILCLVILKRQLWLLPVLTAGWLFASFWTS